MARPLQNAIYSKWRTNLFCLLLLGTILCPIAFGTKFIFASKDDCDRHSLDALYHEKFKPITDDIFADSLEFVSRVLDLVLDSLAKVMADLPGRESSDQDERNMHMYYNEMKKQFRRSINKMKKNVTMAWTELLSVNQNMLLDIAETDLYEVRNKTGILVDTYKHSRSVLDSKMVEVISLVKGVVRGGLNGIRTAAEREIQNERKAAKTATVEEASQTEEKESEISEEEESEISEEEESEISEEEENEISEEEESEEKISEEELQIKMKNITDHIVPAFLCKVSLAVLERKVNLSSEINTTESSRDSVLDDMCFDLILMQNRVLTTVHEDLPKRKESRDLARRNIYMYWTDLASSMYEERIQRAAAPSVGRKEKYKRMWEKEDTLVDTLISLMEVYP